MRERYLKHDWCYWDCCRCAICLSHFGNIRKECKPKNIREWFDWLWAVWTTGFEPPWIWKIRNRKYLKQMLIDNHKSV